MLQFILLEKYFGRNAPINWRQENERTPGIEPEDEAKEWAELMSYHRAENMDLSVPFDGFLYRDCMMIAEKMKKLRYGLDDTCIIEKKCPDDVMDLRNLPVPPYVLRELWVRTQNERAYRWFFIALDMTAEIEEIPTGTLITGKSTGRMPPTGSTSSLGWINEQVIWDPFPFFSDEKVPGQTG